MQKTRRVYSVAVVCGAIVAVAMASGGCATIPITREPLQPVVLQRKGNVIVREFIDKREQPQYIGNRRSGFGNIVGHFKSEDSEKIDVLLTQYFVEALQHAGYTTARDTAIPGSPPLQAKHDAIIEGRIVEFWVDSYGHGYWHRVAVKVQAINPADQKVLWEKSIEGLAKDRGLDTFANIIRRAVTATLNSAAWEFASDDFYFRVIKKQP